MENKLSQQPLEFLKRRSALILTVLLLSQAALFYGFSRNEKSPANRPFDQFPQVLGNWKMTKQGVMEDEIKQVLRADDYLTRQYMNADYRMGADLFVAFFRSQRYGQAPHSPKNCLPGTGWIWTLSDTVKVPIASRTEPIEVNRYAIQNGEAKSLVLYWYQSRDRVVASEYTAKIFVVADALRLNRTDTALVRVVVPVVNGDIDNSTKVASNFVESFFDPLSGYFPR